jgi:hypothetical protein
MPYLIPSVVLLDSSRLHLFKNQATCESGLVTFSQETIGGSGHCGFAGQGFGPGSNQVVICLTDPSLDPILLEGFTVNTTGGSFVMSNCSQNDPDAVCNNGTGYLCDVNDTDTLDDDCVLSLECPDGTLITTCGNSSICVN